MPHKVKKARDERQDAGGRFCRGKLITWTDGERLVAHRITWACGIRGRAVGTTKKAERCGAEAVASFGSNRSREIIPIRAIPEAAAGYGTSKNSPVATPAW